MPQHAPAAPEFINIYEVIKSAVTALWRAKEYGDDDEDDTSQFSPPGIVLDILLIIYRWVWLRRFFKFLGQIGGIDTGSDYGVLCRYGCLRRLDLRAIVRKFFFGGYI